MTTALVAAQFFSGNCETSRTFLQSHGYIPKMLSKSRWYCYGLRVHWLVSKTGQPLEFVLAPGRYHEVRP